MRLLLLAVLALAAAVPAAHGEVEIVMEKPVLSYCDKLAYTVIVSEVTGDPAIIHIRDSSGVSSSAIPLSIVELETLVPAPHRFEKEVFGEGTYHVDIEYAGETATAQFEIAESGDLCFSGSLVQKILLWVRGGVSDGFMLKDIQQGEPEVEIPFEIDETNIYDVDLPGWTRQVGALWATGIVTDGEFAGVMSYLAGEGLALRQDPGIGI